MLVADAQDAHPYEPRSETSRRNHSGYGKRGGVIGTTDLPTLNAILNTVAGTLLLVGFGFIKVRNVRAHQLSMVAAFVTSTLFLTSYLVYHYRVGSVAYTGQGWIRPVYFTILISHILLAAAIVPLALTTLYRAIRGRFDRHVSIARWTLPIWLYVSVTGVVIYLMLY